MDTTVGQVSEMHGAARLAVEVAKGGYTSDPSASATRFLVAYFDSMRGKLEHAGKGGRLTDDLPDCPFQPWRSAVADPPSEGTWVLGGWKDGAWGPCVYRGGRWEWPSDSPRRAPDRWMEVPTIAEDIR